MAADRHDDLDELDSEPSFEIVVDEPAAKRSLDLKPILIGLLILVLGGGLGTGIYLFTAYDTRDLIGLLDIGESAPRLSLELPGRGEAPKGVDTSRGGGLLTPPGAVGGGSGEMLKAVPDDMPPAMVAAPAQAPGQAPAQAPAPPPVADAAADALAKLEAGTAPPPPAPKVAAVDASGMPTQPSPRSAEKQPPSFDTLTAPKGEVKPLLAAPVKDLLRKTQLGDLPYPGPDGRLPWQVYARPWSGPADKGKVAVVVVELGLDKAATEAAIAKLPPEVTLAFSPYAPSLDKWIKKARDHGHEVLMSLPAETGGARDPGPYGLMSGLSPEANLERLETVMSKAAGYAGLISLGGLYATSPQMAATFGAIKDHGLLYVGDGAAAADRAPPTAPVTAVIDSAPFREAIDMRLNQVSIAARTKGRAIAVVNPQPLSFLRLQGWLNDLEGQNLVLTPASTVVQTPPAPGKS
ncbi:MAG: divergent polysaccharide deacetylase family protein [Magnetospirillum sp.]|nr:MAG: divergent polysaccharide deacetylase family protein [Magnetospirillum sp.]